MKWFVIDTDRWNEGNKIDDLRKFVEDKRQTYNGWFVLKTTLHLKYGFYHFNSEKPIAGIRSSTKFQDFVATKIKRVLTIVVCH
ncbi:MAG: hypothetical protein R2836_00025 [Chitinophagales bacterium]